MPFVLDASVALAWILDRPVPTVAVKARQALLAGERALVPGLWHLEVANGLAMAERRGALSATDVLQSLTYIEELSAQFIDTQSEFVSIRHALNLARNTELTVYDAVYLDVARQNGLSLATLDRELMLACSKASVQVFR
jgi:predicted nucleic acid-binding protein